MVRTKRAELHRSFRSCRDFLVAMIPLVGMSMYLYGFRPFIIVLLAGVNAMLCDLTNALLRRRPYDVTDLSSIVFAEVFALMMPASVSYGVILIGTAVTVLLGKHAFGGYENYPCHPAAFGISFAAVCWPSQVFSYPKPFAALGLGFRPDVELFEASSHALNYGGRPYVELSDLITGNFTGPLGTTFCLILLAGLAFLVAHRAVSAHVPLSFIAACAVFSLLFPRIISGRISSLLYELLTSTVIFSAIFLAAEPSVSPKTPQAKIAFGCIAGLLTMLFRYYGQYDFGACFALIICGPLAGYLDRRLQRRTRVRVSKGDEPEGGEAAGTAPDQRADAGGPDEPGPAVSGGEADAPEVPHA